MDPHQCRILFFGTPLFAASCLEYLLQQGFNVVGVVSTPDQPAGRGQRLRSSAVAELARKNDLPLLQPVSLSSSETLAQLSQLEPDLFVVVAFRLLPAELLAIPPLGAFNLHASLLPAYRGAAPIQHAILNGEQITGVTTFRLSSGVDTGPILLQRQLSISPVDNAASLHDKLLLQGRELLALTIEGLAAGTLKKGKPQDEELAARLPKAPKISKQDTVMSFRSQTARELKLMVRAFSPYPAATATLVLEGGEELPMKVYDAQLAMKTAEEMPAPTQIQTDAKRYLRVGCADGALELLEVQLPGKRKMKINDFLNGFTLAAGAHFK